MDVSLIENVPIFVGLDPVDLEKIASKANRQHFPKDSILVYEGQQPDSLYIIVSGKCKVYVGDEEGRELTLGTMSAGDFFGELAIIDGSPRSATVEATEKTQVLQITGREFQEFVSATPSVLNNLLSELARRVRGVNEHIKDLALLDVYGRVARTILRLSREVDGVQVTDAITQQEIANMVGASREMVSRVLNNLKQDGYISIKEKRITILSTLPHKR